MKPVILSVIIGKGKQNIVMNHQTYTNGKFCQISY